MNLQVNSYSDFILRLSSLGRERKPSSEIDTFIHANMNMTKIMVHDMVAEKSRDWSLMGHLTNWCYSWVHLDQESNDLSLLAKSINDFGYRSVFNHVKKERLKHIQPLTERIKEIAVDDDEFNTFTYIILEILSRIPTEKQAEYVALVLPFTKEMKNFYELANFVLCFSEMIDALPSEYKQPNALEQLAILAKQHHFCLTSAKIPNIGTCGRILPDKIYGLNPTFTERDVAGTFSVWSSIPINNRKPEIALNAISPTSSIVRELSICEFGLRLLDVAVPCIEGMKNNDASMQILNVVITILNMFPKEECTIEFAAKIAKFYTQWYLPTKERFYTFDQSIKMLEQIPSRENQKQFLENLSFLNQETFFSEYELFELFVELSQNEITPHDIQIYFEIINQFNNAKITFAVCEKFIKVVFRHLTKNEITNESIGIFIKKIKQREIDFNYVFARITTLLLEIPKEDRSLDTATAAMAITRCDWDINDKVCEALWFVAPSKKAEAIKKLYIEGAHATQYPFQKFFLDSSIRETSLQYLQHLLVKAIDDGSGFEFANKIIYNRLNLFLRKDTPLLINAYALSGVKMSEHGQLSAENSIPAWLFKEEEQ